MLAPATPHEAMQHPRNADKLHMNTTNVPFHDVRARKMFASMAANILITDPADPRVRNLGHIPPSRLAYYMLMVSRMCQQQL